MFVSPLGDQNIVDVVIRAIIRSINKMMGKQRTGDGERSVNIP